MWLAVERRSGGVGSCCVRQGIRQGRLYIWGAVEWRSVDPHSGF